MSVSAASLIEVAFEVPAEIARGLSTGEMVRRGGVIQRAAGETKGEVVAWLRELGALVPEGGSVANPVAEQLKTLQMATSALAVGQALTLGFSVVSFAVLNRKLTILSSKVDRVLAELEVVREELTWLDRRHDIALEAKLRAALDQGEWACRTGRTDALVAVRGSLLEPEHHYRGLLSAMLDSKRAHQHAALFSTYLGLLALAGVARARSEVLLDGADTGIGSLGAVRTILGAIDGGFRQPLRQLDRNLHLLRSAADAERTIRPALETMGETIHRVDGYGTELAFCARHGLPIVDWERMSDAGGEPRLALLLPKKC